MSNILEAMKQRVLLSDGAMGTMLQSKGLPAGVSPEVWMLSNPDSVLEISSSYVKAGAHVLETNTFGANRIKLAEYGYAEDVNLINATAVSLAKKAAGPNRYVAGVIGPSGQFPAPIGSIGFEDLTEVFAQQAQSLSLSGADLILLQTFSDLGEARAAYLGIRKVTNLPVAVSLTYSQNRRTLTGTDPETAALVFSALGADVLGANCSSGPEEMLSVIKIYHESCRLPLLAEPNAGVPILQDNQSVFPLTPEDMAAYTTQFLEYGVRFLGGCCGTAPPHIKAIAEAAKTWDGQIVPALREQASSLTSRSRAIWLGFGLPPRLAGEKLNPTNRKALTQALTTGDFDVYTREGLAQIQAGAELLGVNVGLAGSDEVSNLTQAVIRLQQSPDYPLIIDTLDPEALEKALIHYHGKALVNSVNGKESSLSTVLPLVKKYGAAVLGLTLDENGVPEKAEDRLLIAERILDRATAEGIQRNDVIIDCLVMAAVSDPGQAAETLKALSLVKNKLGLTTILGISNISHGMPKRAWLNQTFLAQAIAAGLDVAIADAFDPGIRSILTAGTFLAEKDPHAARYIEKALAGGNVGEKQETGAPAQSVAPASTKATESAVAPASAKAAESTGDSAASEASIIGETPASAEAAEATENTEATEAAEASEVSAS